MHRKIWILIFSFVVLSFVITPACNATCYPVGVNCYGVDELCCQEPVRLVCEGVCIEPKEEHTIEKGKFILPCKPEDYDHEKGCTKISTGLGFAIETSSSSFVEDLFGIILGISGGIALLLIIISGYKLIASRGNPEKMQGVKESLTSAIIGLLFIIFSLVILEVIGVDILKIPGWR